jgi:alkylation response protein AidB-like acyl-CoA dehydrogenase
MVSVFGRLSDAADARSETTPVGDDAYVFFTADSRHDDYHLIDNVVHMQIYVSTFRLENYPVREEDILHTGVEAFAAALNTVNIGKFNLCTCSIGMVEHAFYEACSGELRRLLRAAGGNEIVQPALGRLPAQREPRRPAVSAVQSRDQGQGHDGGRDDRAVAARCGRRQGL